MRIRSSLKLVIWLTISLILLYSGFSVFIGSTIEAKFRDLRTSSNIRSLFDQLQNITNDYFIFPTERADQQWKVLHSKLSKIMNSQEYIIFEMNYQADNLRDEMEFMGDTFNKLTVAIDKSRFTTDNSQLEIRNLLITQITVTVRGIATSLDNLSKQIEGEVLLLQRSSVFIDIIALAIVAVSIFGIALFLSKSVVRPLLKLHEGAEIIGRGDLDFRVELAGAGEIRELSQGINQMTANLGTLQAALRKSQDDLRYLASQLIISQEEERQYIGLELHDDLGQLLMVLKMQLRTVQKNLAPASAEIRADLENAFDLFNEIVERIRRLSRNLRPTVLEDMGLSTGLKLLFEDFQKYYGLELSVDMDNVEKSFSWEHQILIYRIFQESLTNAAKHSGGTGVNISIRKNGGGVAFQMQDNGQGFNLEEVLAKGINSRGLGLASIEERVRMLGGDLELWSQPGQGTRLSFKVPVDVATV